MPSPQEIYNSEIEAQIEAAHEKVRAYREDPPALPSYSQYLFIKARQAIIKKITQAISAEVKQEVDPKSVQLREVPPDVKEKNPNRVDFAVALQSFGAKFKLNPVKLAKKVCQSLLLAENEGQNTLFGYVENSGPYLNIGFNKSYFLAEFLREYQDIGADYGKSDSRLNQVTVIDFSSPNIAKPFGINHMRSTDIGEALARIYQATGQCVIRDNHYGDWGTQFGNLLAAIEMWADQDTASLSLGELKKLYVRFNKEKHKNPELVKKGRKLFAQLSRGDDELLDEWLTIRNNSLQVFNKVYERLGIKFDTEAGEAYVAERADEIIEELAADEELQNKNLVAVDDDGSVLIPATEDEKLRPIILRTSEGYSVYAARDLATIELRNGAFHPSQIVYVVGSEQKVNFQQVFRLARAAGLTELDNSDFIKLRHADFGLLLGQDGKKLSTRKGTSGSFEDLLEEAVAKARSELEERKEDDPDFYQDFSQEELNKCAEAIGQGVLTWTNLQSRRTENVKLDINRMLQLQEGSSLYIQYTYTRTVSLLDKAAAQDYKLNSKEPNNTAQLTDTELDLAVLASSYPRVIKEAGAAGEPSMVADFLQDFATRYNQLYGEVRVLNTEEDPQVTQSRLLLHAAARDIIKSAAGLLNLPLVERL